MIKSKTRDRAPMDHWKAALTRWILAKHREHRVPLGAREEATHPPRRGQPHFAEDYTFAAVQADLGLVVRLERLPRRQAQRIWVTVLRPGRVDALPAGQQVIWDLDGDRWQAGGLELDCLQPHQRWEVSYEGALQRDGSNTPQTCRLNVQFEAQAEPFRPGRDDDPQMLLRWLESVSWDRSLLNLARRRQLQGYVQVGALTGSLAIGDELIGLRASCIRQHFWGTRDWAQADGAAQWFAAWEDDARIWAHEGRFPFVTVQSGFRQLGTRLVPLQHLEIADELDASRRILVCAEDQLERRSVAAEVCSQWSLRVDNRGEVQIALLSLEGKGHALWAGQRRTLPRALDERLAPTELPSPSEPAGD